MHAVELYLKSLLRLSGYTGRELWGHKFAWLAQKAEAHGLPLDDEDRYVIEVMVHTDAWSRSRYIETGFRVRSPEEALLRACLNFDQSVSEALRKQGHHVRPISWA